MSKYEHYNNDQLEELFSNFLIDSWSYSKVSSFARNEKAFEMSYVYNQKSKRSATTIAGNAYHEGLRQYFGALSEGEILDVIEVEKAAFEYIEDRPAYIWKIQKTTPTVEECLIKANKTSTALIKNFFKEESVYSGELEEILAVEKYIDTWLTINGVDIPLPVHLQIDLVIRTIEGKVVVIDHKSKQSFTDEKESSLSIGKQAIVYAKGYEKVSGIKVDEVWFIENKAAQNRDKSPQLKPIKVTLDDDTRKLYEAILYEPLKRMIEAVSDPDYIYMINDSDKFVDMAEIYTFWAKTMIAEVDEFDIKDSKKDMIAKRLKKIRNAEIASIDPKVISNFKKNAAKFITYDFNTKDMTKAEKIEHLLLTFGISVQVAHEFEGYSSDTLLLEVGVGTKIANVAYRKLDIANALDVEDIRVHDRLFVYKKVSYVAIEVPKERTESLIFDPSLLGDMAIPLGKDNFRDVIYWDLNNHSTPHMLVAGSTGSGKTVFLVSILEYARLSKWFERIIIFDPKYKDFNSYHGLSDVEVYNDIDEIEFQIGYLVEEMNELVKSGGFRKTLVICDEYADLVQTARKPKQLEKGEKTLGQNMQLLLQKSRALGFNFITATQRSSVKVINGDIKVNMPIQVCFRVNKEVDSKVIIDEPGGEILTGYGDGLIKSPSYMSTIRFQSFYKE